MSVLNRGQTVRVRQRQYLVEDIVAAPKAGESTLVRLACIEDDAQGQPLEVLWERELDAEILSGEAWDALATRGFDPPRRFSAYYHTLKWNRVTATDPKLFQSPLRAGIQINNYQLEPLRKALMLPRVNLFIADDVGLGKTIEAGLIARELLLRKKVKDIVVACPPSMLLQWKDELETRFGLTMQILDKEYISRIRRERGYGVNPWNTHSRFLVSQRLLVDEEYTAPLRDWLTDFRAGSLLILDEAHHAAPSSGQRYAIDSKITRAIRDIAPRFEHRLFLSATPHNGHSNSFSALLEILDPQRFCRGVPVKGPAGKKLLNDVMVRRLKEDLREVVSGEFPKRHVVQVDIDKLPKDAPELVLSELLDQYRELREERLRSESKRKQAASGLLICGLQQRLLSSVEAFARTLKVHRRTVLRQFEKGRAESVDADPDLLNTLSTPVSNDDDRAELSEEQQRRDDEAQTEAATEASAARPDQQMLFAKEQKLLDQMTEVAETNRGQPDARINYLADWIRTKMCPGAWNDMRLLIFTEYDDTRRYLVEQLSAAIASTDRADQRIEVFHGPTPADKREEIKHAFNSDPSKHPLRILVATDAAREGLNLQGTCWNLFHFDVPWNPGRLEQRNGRIDRKGQQHEVFCHYFVYRQRAEDKVLQVLVRKTERIKRELGCLNQVLDDRLASALRGGIRHSDAARLADNLDAADLDAEQKESLADELEASRERQEELKKQIDVLRTRLENSKEWLGFNDDHFRDAISCSLEMLGAPGLKARTDSDGQLLQCDFPALDARAGADPSWAVTLDALRPPRKPDQKIWEWRKDAPMRPVVFSDSGRMDDSKVHLHLEHRVVQRLLSRFIAQGYINDTLSRACLAQTEDALPRVVLLGRLTLYGTGAARLHEDLVPITARWIEPTRRKGSLEPFAREAESKALDLLEQALLKKGGKIDSTIATKLQTSGPRDIEELLPHLQARCEALAKEAAALLLKRGDDEAQAMREILNSQKKRISETVRKRADESQALLKFDDDESRQLEADKRHWARRLTALDSEIVSEPARIREIYQVKAQRIEPIGLVYLWPVTG